MTYAFDCGSYMGPSASTASCPTDAVGTCSVGGKVRDDDGVAETEYRASVAVGVTFDSLCALVRVYVVQDVADSLYEKLDAAEAKSNRKDREAILTSFVKQVEGQSGKSMMATGSGDAHPARRIS